MVILVKNIHIYLCVCKQNRAKYVGLAELVVGIVHTYTGFFGGIKLSILTRLGSWNQVFMLPQKSKLELGEQHVAAVVVVVVLVAKTLDETNFHVECIKTLKNSYKTKERTLHALRPETLLITQIQITTKGEAVTSTSE